MLILHSLPGRIRIKNSHLYDKTLSQYIEIYCENLYGVRSCRVNYKTGNLLIVYDDDKTHRDFVIENLDIAIQSALQGEKKN